MPDDVLAQLQTEWLDKRDGASGDAYGTALEAEGWTSKAEAVYRELIESGYLVGYYDLAWLEHGRGKKKRARKLLRTYLAIDDEPDEQTDLVAGVLGHWVWDSKEDPSVEELLRSGMIVYPDARADLAHLLVATDRVEEAEAVLRDGIELREEGSFIVLGNLLRDSGRTAEAEDMYRQGYALGDAFSAYNLCVLLLSEGRPDEALAWLRRAADGGDAKAIARLALGESWEHPPQ